MFSLAFLTALAMPFGLHAALPNFGFLQQILSVQALLPAIVETGDAAESFSAPQNLERPVAFGPDGSSYSVYNSYYLLKIAPDGSTSYIQIHFPVPNRATEYGAIVYADGYLWFQSFEGYIHMKPDGTNVTYHQQAFGNPVAPAPGGVYVALRTGIEFIDGTTYRRSLYPIVYNDVAQFNSVGPMTLGKDGRLYFDFEPNSSFLHHLARLNVDGTATIFAGTNVCGAPAGNGTSRLVASASAIYFIGRNDGYVLCRTTYTGFFAQLTPPYSYVYGSVRPYAAQVGIGIDIDGDGNVWTANVIGAGLYSYNALTSQVAGPYQPNVLQSLGGDLNVGPDQNVWVYGEYAVNQVFYGAYVRHLETFAPTSVNLSFVGQALDFYVSEPLKSAPWTAYSLNSAVASVRPGSYVLGKFKVTAVSPGSTAIVVTDAYGNARQEPVTVTANARPF